MMGTFEAIILLCALAFALNMVMLVKSVKDYRAAKRRARREKTVLVRAEDLAAVIAEFVNE